MEALEHKFILTNDRSLQLQIRETPGLYALFNEVVYISEISNLPVKMLVYQPLVVILVQRKLDHHFPEIIADIKSDLKFPLFTLIVITDSAIPADIKPYIAQVLPANYSSEQLVQVISHIIANFVDMETEYAKQQIKAKTDASRFNNEIVRIAEQQEKRRQELEARKLAERIENEKAELRQAFVTYNEDLLAGFKYATDVTSALSSYKLTGPEEDSSVIQNRLVMLFWELFKHIAYELVVNKTIPLAQRLFLRYGIMDTELLSEQIIDHLCANPYSNIYGDPVFFVDEWLPTLYNGEREISFVDEIKYKIPAKEYKTIQKDKALTMELETLRFMNKIAAGKRGYKLPALDRRFVAAPAEETLVTREAVKQCFSRIDELIDPTLCRRATIQGIKHVPPVFLIVPGYGRHSLCWQVCDKNDRDFGPARMICPAVSLTSIEESIIAALATYRWEYTKAVLPTLWEDEGLIADYSRIKKLPQGELLDYFIRDYYTWITKESDNRTMLSRDLRRFFWVKTPFGKEIIKKVKDNVSYRELYLNYIKRNCLI